MRSSERVHDSAVAAKSQAFGSSFEVAESLVFHGNFAGSEIIGLFAVIQGVLRAHLRVHKSSDVLSHLRGPLSID